MSRVDRTKELKDYDAKGAYLIGSESQQIARESNKDLERFAGQGAAIKTQRKKSKINASKA